MRVTTRMNGDARMSSANRIISAIKMKSTAKLRGITGMYSNAKMRVAAETGRY